MNTKATELINAVGAIVIEEKQFLTDLDAAIGDGDHGINMARGFEAVRQQQIALGQKVRALFESRGLPSVAAEGFKAPGVVVSYTTDPDVQNAKKFLAVGIQAAAGVPLMCDEPADFRTFRVGLFGLDKWANVDRSVAQLQSALDKIGINATEKVAAHA